MFPNSSNLCYKLEADCILLSVSSEKINFLIRNQSRLLKTMRPRLYIFPCPSSREVQVCVRWYWLNVCVFWSYPNMRETTVHPLPSSESSTVNEAPGFDTVTFFLVVSAPPPHPSCSFFPGQLEEQLQADRASNDPPSLHSNVPFNLHAAPPGPFTPRLNLSHSLSTGHQ